LSESKSTGGATQASPDVAAELILRRYPLVEAAVSATGVDPELAEMILPLAVRIALSIKFEVSGATLLQDEPL